MSENSKLVFDLFRRTGILTPEELRKGCRHWFPGVTNLVKQGLIEKLVDGRYQLTRLGIDCQGFLNP